MIKVNLLRDQTVQVHKTIAKSTISRMGLIFLAVFVVLAGGIGGWWYYISIQVTGLTVARDNLRIEDKRLKALQKEIEKYEKLKSLRQNRIEVIEKLKENQTGPVLLLNHVIQSVPRDGSLWLTLLEQKDERIKISGFAQRNEAIPDFMISLSATGFFRSVDLEVMENDKDASRFSLICTSIRKQQAE